MKANTIVILHGWGLSGATFIPLAQILVEKGYRVFTPDLPGFGTAAAPVRPYVLADYVGFVADYCRAQRIREPIFIGHSFGGRVALKYSAMYPKDVRALILSGTPGFTHIPRKKLLLFIVLAKIGGLIFSLPPLNLVQDAVRRWYYYVVGAKDFFRAEGMMRETFKLVVQESLVVSMESINIPTLLLWGEFDVIVPPAIAQKMEHVIAGTQLIIVPDADHGVAFKEPKTFARYVDAFLRSL